MGKKRRTYSLRDKKHLDTEHEVRLKRRKGDDNSELFSPANSTSNSPKKPSSLLRKGLKAFGGPVSIPDDDTHIDFMTKSKNRFSVLGNALEGTLKSVKHNQRNFYGNGEDVKETMNDQTLARKSNRRRNSNLLTTPPGLQKQVYKRSNQSVSGTDRDVAELAALTTEFATESTTTSRTPGKIIKCSGLKQPHVPKQYETSELSTPMKTLSGYRLSSESVEAKL